MMVKNLAQIASASVRFQSASVRLATENRTEHMAHGRRRGFDPVAPAFIPIPLAVQASKRIRHPPLLLEMQHALKACACRLHTGAAGSGLAWVPPDRLRRRVDSRNRSAGCGPRRGAFADSVLKRNRPVIRLWGMPSPCVGMQVVHDIAATKNENAFFSQDR
jgi:hypothetical protein